MSEGQLTARTPPHAQEAPGATSSWKLNKSTAVTILSLKLPQELAAAGD